MSDSHEAVVEAEIDIPPEFAEFFASFARGDGQGQAPSLDVTTSLSPAHSDLEGDRQVLDPENRSVGGNGAADDLQTTESHQITNSMLPNHGVPAFRQQGSSMVGLQLSISLGRLRQGPNSPASWAAYFRNLPQNLPRLTYLLAGFRTPFHPSASMSDYLVRVISGDLRGGPVAGAGMHLMALYGLAELPELDILNLVIHLDLSARFYRRAWLAMRSSRDRHAAVAEAKTQVVEAERESYERLKHMYEGECEQLGRDRARLDQELEMLEAARTEFQRDLARLGNALGLGTTIEELQLNHGLLMQRLRAVLESTVISSTAELQLLSNMGIPGGMQEWRARFQEILRGSADQIVSAQPSQAGGAQSLSQSPLANRIQLVIQRLAAREVQLAAQQVSHDAAVKELEAENEKLKKQVEDLKKDLQEHQPDNDKYKRYWFNPGCLVM